jgi:hypothetical protein
MLTSSERIYCNYVGKLCLSDYCNKCAIAQFIFEISNYGIALSIQNVSDIIS